MNHQMRLASAKVAFCWRTKLQVSLQRWDVPPSHGTTQCENVRAACSEAGLYYRTGRGQTNLLPDIGASSSPPKHKPLDFNSTWGKARCSSSASLATLTKPEYRRASTHAHADSNGGKNPDNSASTVTLTALSKFVTITCVYPAAKGTAMAVAFT